MTEAVELHAVEAYDILRTWAMAHPLISSLLGILVIISTFLYFPWVVSREHKISYRTAIMNMWIWIFRDRTEARLLRLAHEEKGDNK